MLLRPVFGSPDSARVAPATEGTLSDSVKPSYCSRLSMLFTNSRCCHSAAVVLAVVMATACVDSPLAPPAVPTADVLRVTSANLVNKPPLDNTLEGEAWVCEDGAEPAGPFTFAVSVDGGPATTHSVARGTCVMVHSVPTTGQHFATVSVTENTPAGWTLTGITIESDETDPKYHQPSINPPNASARISHDYGVVITFTNTADAPPPGPRCTLTQGYWKNHGEDWDQVSDGKPFLTTTTFYNSGTSYLAIMGIPPKGGNAYLQLAHQFIAASLNLNGGASGVAEVDAALEGAATYFAGAPAGIPNPGEPTRSQLQGWATTLDDFNNGRTGPGHCD
jgi:hypothetical protein